MVSLYDDQWRGKLSADSPDQFVALAWVILKAGKGCGMWEALEAERMVFKTGAIACEVVE